MARFVAMPGVQQGLTPWQKMFMDAAKENIELLTGQRGDLSKSAVLKGDVQVDYLTSISAAPSASDINTIIDRVNLLISVLKE